MEPGVGVGDAFDGVAVLLVDLDEDAGSDPEAAEKLPD